LEVIGIDSDSNGLLDNGGGELINISFGDIGERFNINRGVIMMIVAFSFSGLIRVFSFSGNSSSLNIFKGIIHQSSVTSLISIFSRAINELFFRERFKFFFFNERGSFEGSGGREGPARSTLSLIFDGSDGSSFVPVDRGG